MDPGQLDELIAIESTYWWHVAKRAMVIELLQRHFPPPGRLVEGGVGAGGNLLAFRKMGYEVTGFDLMSDAVRRKEFFVKRLLFCMYYRVLNAISRTPIPRDAGNFGLVDGEVARRITQIPGRDRYCSGLRSWVEFRQAGIEVERQARYNRKPRVSLMGLWRLAKTGIFSFSTFPLAIFYGIAFLSTLAFLGLAGFTLYHKLVTGWAIPGWASHVMTAAFFGALNSLGIAVLGEYILRIYDQVRGRPMYLVGRKVNLEEAEKR